MGIFDDLPEVDYVGDICKRSFNAGVTAAIDQLQFAREEGESDLRQIIHWAESCKFKEEEY